MSCARFFREIFLMCTIRIRSGADEFVFCQQKQQTGKVFCPVFERIRRMLPLTAGLMLLFEP